MNFLQRIRDLSILAYIRCWHGKIRSNPCGSNKDKESILWLDLETGGLDPANDLILEVSLFITDFNLVRKGPELNIVISHSEDALKNIDTYCRDMHTKNCLLEEVRESITSLEQADKMIHKLLLKYTNKYKVSLAGFSIHFDREFMRQMPLTYKYLGHRVIDVSTIRELNKAWECVPEPEREEVAHRATTDINAAYQYLQYYKERIFSA